MSPAQLAALKAAIAAETDPTFAGYRANGQTTLMASWFNQAHATVRAWSRAASWQDIANAIDFSKYTPTPANTPTDTPGTNRMLGILVKLAVQQNMLLMTQVSFDATDLGNIDALLDTVTQIPSGASGNTVNAAGVQGVNVAVQLTRAAKRGEAVFGGNDVTKGTVTAKQLAWEGDITDADISAALAS